ncbi:zinc-finger homeodomain protein 9-like [Camellia sinensis]|uniref:zinc-finger homeodomain protein 9-like n=1 Tax=Camellia sinensis TaxID=4442 RepID=UPI001036D016|nr:zinc-finger homeodomain protein 9-like [Camellia sinensis]
MPICVAPGSDHILGEMAATTPLLQLPILALSHSAPADPAGGGDGSENPNEDEYLGDGEVEEEREPMRRRREKGRLTLKQKASMREYAAETLEWSLWGHNEEELIQFCSDIGIVPQVFKVWMRNNRSRYMDAGEASFVDEI